MSPYSGGDEGNRTPDPLLAKQVLSQLSYTPMLVGLAGWFFFQGASFSVILLAVRRLQN